MSRLTKIYGPLIILAVILAGLVLYFHRIKPQGLISQTQTDDKSLEGYYQQAQQLSAPNQPATTTAAFLAVGDIMLSRDVASAIIKSGNVSYPFLNMAAVLQSTDFNFANLEGPVAPSIKDERIGGSSLIFGDASSSLQSLKDYNFQIINLANNHAWDQGLAGVDATIKTLDGLGIVHEGTGDSLDQAWTPAVVSANGIKICFVGAAYGTNTGGTAAAEYVAEIGDTARLKSAINQAKSECDFTVATMHAGIEYTRAPNSQQITFAHAAIDDGADMVIGAHPHWVQPIEKYDGKYIFYSLGNFIFDQDFSQDTMEGLALKISLSKNGGCSLSPLLRGDAPSASEGQRGCADDLQGPHMPAQLDSIELLPVIIQNSQPRPATPAETKNILQKIGQSRTVLYP